MRQPTVTVTVTTGSPRPAPRPQGRTWGSWRSEPRSLARQRCRKRWISLFSELVVRSSEVRPEACSSQRPREKVNTTTGSWARVRREASRDRYTPRSLGRSRKGREAARESGQKKRSRVSEAGSGPGPAQGSCRCCGSFPTLPVQGRPGAWAAWPRRSAHVCSSSPSSPPRQRST